VEVENNRLFVVVVVAEIEQKFFKFLEEKKEN